VAAKMSTMTVNLFRGRFVSPRAISLVNGPANPQAYTSDPSLQHHCGMRCRTTSSGGDDHVLALRGCDSDWGGHPYFSGAHEFSLSIPPQIQGDCRPSQAGFADASFSADLDR
jgi:hypothetical protein